MCAQPNGTDPASMVVQRRVEWHDTDAGGIWHNTAAFRLFETAETALLDRLGLLEEIYGRLPRAHLEADFGEPLRFKDLVDVEVWVEGLGRTSITYAFRIRKDGAVAASGRAICVLVDHPGGHTEEWPEDLRKALLQSGRQTPECLVDGGGAS